MDMYLDFGMAFNTDSDYSILSKQREKSSGTSRRSSTSRMH